MPVIAARRYVAGKPSPEDIAINGVERTLQPPQSFDWVGLAEPTQEEMELIRSQFALHPGC